MADEISELLKAVKAAKDLLPPPEKDGERPRARAVLAPKGDKQGDRKVSVGDVARAAKDYEREPLDKK